MMGAHVKIRVLEERHAPQVVQHAAGTAFRRRLGRGVEVHAALSMSVLLLCIGREAIRLSRTAKPSAVNYRFIKGMAGVKRTWT
jgi:hypothetical protein